METHTPLRSRSQKLGIGGLALLACIAAALIGLVCSPRAAHAAVGDYGTLEDGTYTVTARLSAWMNWDVTDGSTSNNAKIQSYRHNGTAAQVWKITTDSDGYSTIINVKSGKALDVPDGTVADGKQLQQYTPNGTKAQKWKIIERSDAYKIVSAIDETYAIDLDSGSVSDHAAIQIWKDGNADNERWHIDKVADQTTTVLPDQTKLFDSSVYITDTQAGTYTWEKVPDGWEVVETDNSPYAGDIRIKALQYKSGNYAGGNAEAVLRIDKCGKVEGKWLSLRLTFSNMAGSGLSNTWIKIKDNNIWSGGIGTFSLAQVDLKVEAFETESGEAISLKGAYFTAASLNYHCKVQPEGVRYLTDESFKSYLLKGHGLGVYADGSWQGTERLGDADYGPSGEIDWEDCVGGNNFILSGIGLCIADDAPVFRLYLTANWPWSKFIFNLSPLTIATPEGPTKSATITG